MDEAAKRTHQNAVATHERSVAANQSAATATQQADLAMGYRNTAGLHAGTAGTKAAEASASATAAGQSVTAAAAERVLAEEAAGRTQQDAQFVVAALDAATGGPVVTIGGKGGVVPLMTINGQELTQSGNLVTDSKVLRVARTSNVAIAATDIGKLIDITSGTFTQTFAAAAALGNGWWCYLRNSGTGDITLDPNASELIDGLTSYVMYPAEVRIVQCDGSGLRSVVLNCFYREFTASGSFITPPGYRGFAGHLLGGGGGGGAGMTPYAGGGGATGAGREFFIPASETAAGQSNSVVIGAGGSGSAGVSGQTLVAGAAGGDSSVFGVVAYGGDGALAAASNNGAPAPTRGPARGLGSDEYICGAGGGTNASYAGGTQNAYGALLSGGGGGSKIVGGNGGKGRGNYDRGAGALGGGVGQAGGDGVAFSGGGGGGGINGTTGTGGKGGNGGVASGGGGGGSGGTSSGVGGAGGTGGRGELRIWGGI